MEMRLWRLASRIAKRDLPVGWESKKDMGRRMIFSISRACNDLDALTELYARIIALATCRPHTEVT